MCGATPLPGSPVRAGWIVLVGLGLAMAAAVALLSGGPAKESAPLGEIRDDSREAMRDLLRDAESRTP